MPLGRNHARTPSPAPFPKLLDALKKTFGLLWHPTGEVPTNLWQPQSCALSPFGICLGRNFLWCMFCLLTPWPSHREANAGWYWEWGGLFPQEGGPAAPASLRRLGLELRGAAAAQVWQKRGVPGAPLPVSRGLVVTTENTVPPPATPAPAMPAPGTPELKTSLKFFGRAGPPREVWPAQQRVLLRNLRSGTGKCRKSYFI